jgi:putative sterol carrier protein
MPPESTTQPPEAAEKEALMVHAKMDRLKTNPFDERFRSVKGSYLFDIEGAGSWRIDVDHGKIRVTEGATGADCVVRTGIPEFVRIANGEMNLLTAFMRGQVEVEGDLALAQKLIGITPAPAQGGKQPGGAS